MFSRILIGFAPTEAGDDAVALGRLLASASGAELRQVEVGSGPVSSPAAGLEEQARSWGADLVVLGSSRRAERGHLVVGGVAERLLHAAPWSVAVAPRDFAAAERRPAGSEDPGLRVIGVGFDGSPEAERALRVASELAARNGAALRVFTVLPPLVEDPEPLVDDSAFAWHPGLELRDALHQAVAELPAAVRAEEVVLRGSPAGKLLEETEKGLDLLVVGSHGDGPLRHALRREPRQRAAALGRLPAAGRPQIPLAPNI